MRHRYWKFLLVVWSLIGASPAFAWGPRDQAPSFVATIRLERAGGPREPFQVLIGLQGGNAHEDQAAVARVRLGPGLEFVSRDSFHVAHVSRFWKGAPDNFWRITMRSTRFGRSEIRVLMGVGVDADRKDEYECVLPIEVNSSGVHAGVERPVRAETIRNGVRYRYDKSLIPIEGP